MTTAVAIDADVVPVEDLAAQQDGLFTVRQAIRSGLSRGQIAWRRASGRYRRCRRGVVQVAGAPPSWRQAVRMASLAAGEPAVVSHASAVRLFGLELPPSAHRRWRRDNAFIELVAPIPRHVRVAGVRGHRSGAWEDGDVVRCSGMAVTSPLRTLIDLSSRLGAESTGRLFDEMLRRKLVTVAELRARVARLRAAPGRSVRVLRAVLADRDGVDAPSQSTLEGENRCSRPPEGAADTAVGQHGLTDGSFAVRLDFAYPDMKVDVEAGSFPFGRTASDLDRDVTTRDGLFQMRRVVLQFTLRVEHADIEHHLTSFHDRGSDTWRRLQ